MNHISRRNFIKATGVSLAGLSLAACGEKASSTTAASSEIVTNDDGIATVGNTYVSDLPIAVEPITYYIMNNINANDKSGSQSKKEIITLSTADTNVSLDWSETSSASYNEALSLILATGDGLPDAFLTSTISEVMLASNPEDFYSIDEENFKTFAPNIYTAVQEHIPGGIDALKKADGKIYALPTGVWSEYANWANAISYIRQDWLDALGLSMPTTIQDLYDVLVAFKENCKTDDGNAITPLIFCQAQATGKLQFLAGAWGIVGRKLNDEYWFGRVENGVYSMNINTQAFKDFLTEMHRWHQAGLINIDGFSMSNSEYQSLINTKAYGMISTWAPTVEDWEAGKFAAMPVLTTAGYEGKELKSGETGMRTCEINGFAISSACKEPQGMLRWWDHCHSSAEWKRIGRDGPVDGAWEYAEDGITAYVKAVNPMPSECASDTDYQNTYGFRTLSPLLVGNESAIPNPDTVSQDGIRYEASAMYEAYYAPEHVPLTPVPETASSAFAFVQEEIITTVSNFMASAVMNGFTDADWDTYCANLEAVGIQDWVTYYQNCIDGTWE